MPQKTKKDQGSNWPNLQKKTKRPILKLGESTKKRLKDLLHAQTGLIYVYTK